MNSFIVYVTYFSTVERMYAYKTLDAAEAKQLALCKEWVTDTFDSFIKDNNINLKDVTLETYDDYFMKIESDVYIGIEEVVIQ